MYTYNKNDKSYTFSFDDIDIDKMINSSEDDKINSENNNQNEVSDETKENHENNQDYRKPPKKIEVINGGNDLDISPVTDYIEAEKPKNKKKENTVIPEDNK